METGSGNHIVLGVLFEAARLRAELDGPTRLHLEACEHCRRTFGWMSTAADLGRQEPAFEPPESLMEQVLRIAKGPSLLKQVQHFLVASLTFDSFQNLAATGIRRSDTSSRRMTFEAGDLEIAFSINPSSAKTFTLMGQVLQKSGDPIEDAAARIDLVIGGDHMASSSLSSWGEFVFQDLRQGDYDLQFAFTDREIRVPSLRIGKP